MYHGFGEGELWVTERVPGGVHIEPRPDVFVVPGEVRLVGAGVDLDDSQVVALRHADHLGVVPGYLRAWQRLLLLAARIERIIKGALPGSAWDELLRLALGIGGVRLFAGVRV